MSLWGGRFTEDLDPFFKQFNDSLPFDYQLVEQDIVGSKAWATAICQAGVISETELTDLKAALDELLNEVRSGKKKITDDSDEDIHSWVERNLIEKVGQLGKKLHTGRSRNDQVSTDLRLWCKTTGEMLQDNLKDIQQTLITIASDHTDTIMPGYTHLQRAQPISFGHWCMAYVEMFSRDLSRLRDALYRLNFSPLGSGALAGTAYPINRESLAQNLGFNAPTLNSLDAVSDRDFVFELISAASLSMIHLSRMAEDCIFYNTQEAAFLSFGDAVTTGSSLMPQKKNPDGWELVRGKTGRVLGALNNIAFLLKSLPLAYNKDMQEDKPCLFDALTTWQNCLVMANQCLINIKVNKDNMYKAVLKGFCNATELADYLVSKGMPFRDAHDVVGEAVRFCIEQNCTLEALSIEQYQQFSDLIADDLYPWLDPLNAINQRNVTGGTAVNQVRNAVDFWQTQITQADKVVIRDARMTDVNEIHDIVAVWTEAGDTLPRTKDSIIHDIQDFVVAEDLSNPDEPKIIGCASLYIYQTGLAEIRSVGITPEAQGKRIGQRLISRILRHAQAIRLNKVIVLTRVPEFFSKQGFEPTAKESLPEKVLKDCDACPRKENCDEFAMELNIGKYAVGFTEVPLDMKTGTIRTAFIES